MQKSAITKMQTVLIAIVAIAIIVIASVAYVYLTPSTTKPPVTGVEFYKEAGKPYAGTTIRVAYLTGEYFDEYSRAVLAPEFEELTGIKVLVDDMGAGALRDKLLADFRAGRTSYDEVSITAFFGLGMFYQEGGRGYFEDLSPYFLNSSLADPDYDFVDLDHRSLNYLGYWNHTTKMQGQWVGPGIEGTGTLYMIPGPHTDTMLLTYNRDILAKYNQTVPTTWEDFLKVAQACTHPEDNVWGATFVGIPLLHFIGEFAPRFASYVNAPVGSSPYVTGTILEGNLMPQMDSPAAKAALNNEIALKQYIPPGATSWDISNAQDAFALGKCAMMVQHASMIGSVYKPSTSIVYDKINSTLLPGPPGAALRGGWGRGISRFSANKEATFLWLQYSSRKAADFGANLIYGMNPIRSSTFQRPEFIAKFPFALKSLEASQIGHYIPVYLPSIMELMVKTDLIFIDVVGGAKTVDAGTAEVQQIWVNTLRADGLIP